MRLPNSAHTSRPWRIHEITQDFQLEDVWALPTPGGHDDFHLLVEALARATRRRRAPPALARALWAIRWKLGEIFGWDDPRHGRRLAGADAARPAAGGPARRPAGPEFASLPFTPLYLLDDEFAAEVANKTVHGVMHLGWVPDGAGGYRGQMAVLVKPNGLFGKRLHGRDQAVPRT